jgi:hypothetical protein
LLPNEELDGDTGAAFAVTVSDGIAISEISARAAMNFLMTHLLVTERCPVSCNNDTGGSPCLAVTPEIGLWNDRISYTAGSIG